MTITTKVTKNTTKNVETDDKLIKLIESIDWKLWEIYNMLKNNPPEDLKKKKG